MSFKTRQLLFGFLILAFCCLNIKGNNQTEAQKIPTLKYCNLVKEPSKYDNKIIRVKVIFSVFFEVSFMYDENCKNARGTWVEFDSAVVASTNLELLKRFEQLTYREESDPSRQVEVIWVGLFQGIKQAYHKEGNITLYQGFGHMNRYEYQFTVQKIEELVQTKTKRKGK